MALDPELIKILACPTCHNSISSIDNDQGLLCINCKCVYPVYDDIPVMLEDKAIREEDWQQRTL